jgi:hypothetical protein
MLMLPQPCPIGQARAPGKKTEEACIITHPEHLILRRVILGHAVRIYSPPLPYGEIRTPQWSESWLHHLPRGTRP